MSVAKPPKHLAEPGRELWSEITKVHASLRAEQLRILVDACGEADVIDRLETELRSSELMVRGSQGQLVASPLVSEVRQHRSVLAGLLKALRLPETNAEAVSREAETSEKARQAARARWDRPRLVS